MKLKCGIASNYNLGPFQNKFVAFIKLWQQIKCYYAVGVDVTQFSSEQFNLLRHIKNMEAKSSSQMGYFRRFFYPMFANCVHTKTMFVHVSEHEVFFSLNCSKFAEECDWNSNNSQKVQTLGFFGKIDWFSSKKTLKYFKIATCGNFC